MTNKAQSSRGAEAAGLSDGALTQAGSVARADAARGVLKAGPGDSAHRHRGGRRKGTSTTRDEILQAAVELFAERGYEKASLRAITSRAGVDVSLVRHFFGDKAGLFDAAVLKQAQIGFALEEVLKGDPPALSQRIAEAYLDLWEQEPSASTVRAIFRSAVESDKLRERLPNVAMGFLETTTLTTLISGENSPKDGRHQAEIQLQLLGAHLLGTGIARYIVKIPPISELSREEMVADLVPLIERYIRPTQHDAGA